MRWQLSLTVEKMGKQKHKGSKYEYIMIILQNSDQLANNPASAMELEGGESRDTDPVVEHVATARVLYLCELIVNINMFKKCRKSYPMKEQWTIFGNRLRLKRV
jgi:hypothetical protein